MCISPVHHRKWHTRSSTRKSFLATNSPMARCSKSNQSDNTLSSSEWSPMRRPRPHSVSGRLPSYASPTFSSQAHHGRSAEKKVDGNQHVCHRFRKFLLYTRPTFTFTFRDSGQRSSSPGYSSATSRCLSRYGDCLTRLYKSIIVQKLLLYNIFLIENFLSSVAVVFCDSGFPPYF